jgi:hypothetical protein
MSEFAASGDLLAAPIAAAKTDVLARSPGNGPDQLRTGDWHDFRTLRDSEFRLAPGDDLCGLSARHKYGFPFHLLGYAETIEDASKMHAAHAAFRRVGIDDRSSAQESMLEGVNRADIRLWRAAARSHRHWGSRHVHDAVRQKLVLLLDLIHHWPRQDDDIGRLSVENPLFEFNGQTVADIQFVARGLLERRGEFVQNGSQRNGGQQYQIGCMRHLGRRERCT